MTGARSAAATIVDASSHPTRPPRSPRILWASFTQASSTRLLCGTRFCPAVRRTGHGPTSRSSRSSQLIDDVVSSSALYGLETAAVLRRTLARAGLADPVQRVSPLFVRLRSDLRAAAWPSAVRSLVDRLTLPEVDEKAVAGLKFSAALPWELAVATLATRLADFDHAAAVLATPVRFENR